MDIIKHHLTEARRIVAERIEEACRMWERYPDEELLFWGPPAWRPPPPISDAEIRRIVWRLGYRP